MAKEDVSVDDKITQIIAEHDADTRGLINKRDELLGSEKKLKETIKSYNDEKAALTTKITGLEDELKKNSPEENKKFYEAQLASIQKESNDKYNQLLAERDFYKTSHLKRLEDDAIADGVKDLQFMGDVQKRAFIALVKESNEFVPTDIDGQTLFLNKDKKTIQEAFKAFALTSDGKSFLKNPSSGSGAKNYGTAGSGNKTMTRAEYDALVRTNPVEARKRVIDKWIITD